MAILPAFAISFGHKSTGRRRPATGNEMSCHFVLKQLQKFMTRRALGLPLVI